MKFSFLVPVLLLCAVARADVASVRRQVAHIDAMKLSQKTYDRSDLSSEGAQISMWRDGKGITHKIVGHIYGETGREHDTIYLNNDLPVFMLIVKEHYKGPISPTVKVGSRTEMRLYFEKGQLFQMRDGNKIVTMTAAQKREWSEGMRGIVKSHLAYGEQTHEGKR